MKLGQWFICTHKLKRATKGAQRIWEVSSIYPVKVMVIGKRLLWDGSVYTEYADKNYTAFERGNKVKAVKVAQNLVGEFLCLPEHLLQISE